MNIGWIEKKHNQEEEVIFKLVSMQSFGRQLRLAPIFHWSIGWCCANVVGKF